MPRSRGFTLIELLVVMLLIGIILGMIGLQAWGQEGAEAEQESRRLALTLQMAQQEAILQGEILAIEIREDGYQFLRLDAKQEFKPLEGDDVLRARAMPAGVSIESIDVEGARDNAQREKLPTVIVFPTGEQSSFGATFVQGKVRWRIEGSANGEIKYERAA